MDKKRANFPVKEIKTILLFFLVLFLTLSISSYNPEDPSLFSVSSKKPSNFFGKIGAIVSDIFIQLFGLSSLVIIIYLLFLTYKNFMNEEIERPKIIAFGYFLLLLSTSSILQFMGGDFVFSNHTIHSGGIVGKYTIKALISVFNYSGTSFILIFTFLIALILSFNFSLKKFVVGLYTIFSNLRRRIFLFYKEVKLYFKRLKEKREEKYLEDIEKKVGEKPVKKSEQILIVGEEEKKKKERKRITLMPEDTKELEKRKKRRGAFVLPPLSLLDASSVKSSFSVTGKELEEKKRLIEEKLREFRVEGEVVEYHPGPVISTFEFRPARGVKIKEISSLSEDLSLALKAENVRITRLLGKSTIGIEIPNNKRQIIRLREVLESDLFKGSKSKLTIGLGKNVRGDVVVADLAKMPHLLIAGATGMGKSVAIHSIILSILYKALPDEVKFILVDPKRLEFSAYEQLPHLLTKVVLDPKEASMALKWAIFEMENRLKKIALFQSRNILTYNQKVQDIISGKIKALPEWEEAGIEKMPFIVIIIDELADLMMVASKDVESSIGRLAQMARAVGIHLVLATQRPSTDVITGTIKNNLPSRIALRVPSQHDSRTIIDSSGAEKLLGNGDMLFMPPASMYQIRLHGAYVSEEEVIRVVKFLREQSKPKFDSSVLKPIKKGDDVGSTDNGEVDSEFIEAVRIVISTGKASASYLQRKMSIGYNKAARFIEKMEEMGIVSQAQGSKPRDVLVGEEFLEKMLKKKFGG